MAIADRIELEERLRALHAAGELAGAATLAMREYGAEIFGYLVAVMGGQEDAGEVFGGFTEDLWRGLAAFRWESSLRTWAYTVARHAMHRFLRSPWRRGERLVSLSQAADVAQAGDLAAEARTASARWLRTSVKDRFAQLRGRMSEEERSLLTLRVDRRMRWDEVARVLDETGDAGATAVNRVKKKFERLKKKLHEWAAAEGLLPEEEPPG